MIKKYLELLRVKHWVKNVFVLAPFIFAGQIFNHYLTMIIVFFSFCFASSSIYIINDIIDKKNDRLHPVKKKGRLLQAQYHYPMQ